MPALFNTWIFQFIVNGSDIIDIGHLDNASVIEDAGTILPTFECSFSHDSTDILQYLNEGNVITLRIGRNEAESVSGKYRIHSVKHSTVGNGGLSLYVNGIYDALPFLNNSKTRIFAKKTASEVISEIGKEYFRVENSVTTSDSMNWMQTGMSDKKFMNDVWIHSYVSDTTPVLGITADGVLRVKTIKDILSYSKMSFGTIEGPGYIDQNYSLEQNTTWHNAHGGYGQIRVQDDVEKGTGKISLSDQTVQGSQNEQTPRTAKASPRIMQTRFKNSNIHEHYWDTQSANLSRLLALNNITLTFTFKNFFNDIHVLDCINFVEINSQGSLDTNISGKYMITKITRSVRNNQLMTLVQCARENINNSKGDFLTSFFNGLVSGDAMKMINSVISNIGGLTISSNLSIGSIFNSLNDISANNIAGKALSLLSSSLKNSRYIQSYNSLISALQNPFQVKSLLLSNIPVLQDIDSKINQILNFDGGKLLNNVLMTNLKDLFGISSIDSFAKGQLDKLANNIMSHFGISMSDLIGPMQLAYRNPIDAALNEIISNIKDYNIKIDDPK